MEHQVGQTYKYSPLPPGSFVRLLRILSGPGEPVRCSLHEVNLDTRRRYDCLSYTWGDPLYHELSAPEEIKRTTDRREIPITCDGLVIMITENLHEALLQLSINGLSSPPGPYHYERQELIWIDAVCIDQENVLEQSSQVHMMTRIYESAQTVIVWLGISDAHTEFAIYTINQLASVSSEKRLVELPTDLESPEVYRILDIPYIVEYQWLDCAAFLQRTWFSRIWVLQEACVARDIIVFCGNDVLLWSDITAATQLLQETRLGAWLSGIVARALNPDQFGRSTQYPRNILNNQIIFAEIRKEIGSLSLEKLSLYNRHFNATNDKDRVFALLGIWKQSKARGEDEHHQELDYVANYEKSVEQVYTEASWVMMRETRDFNLLSLVEDSSVKRPNLPSWVPDYSLPRSYNLIDNVRPAVGEERWNAGYGLTCTVPVAMDGYLLPVEGIQFDTIVEFAATESEIDDDDQMVTLLEVLEHFLDQPYNPCGQTGMEAFWRTLIKDTYRGHPAGEEARRVFPLLIVMRVWELELNIRNTQESIDYPGDCLPDENLASKLARLQEIYSQIQSLIANLSSRAANTDGVIPSWATIRRTIDVAENVPPGEEERDELDRGYDHVSQSFSVAYSGRRLFRTERNYLGVGPQSLRKGDKVWVLAGVVVPMVLRRGGMEGKGDSWRLMGETYVWGIMGGEAVEGGGKVERIYLE